MYVARFVTWYWGIGANYRPYRKLKATQRSMKRDIPQIILLYLKKNPQSSTALSKLQDLSSIYGEKSFQATTMYQKTVTLTNFSPTTGISIPVILMIINWVLYPAVDIIPLRWRYNSISWNRTLTHVPRERRKLLRYKFIKRRPQWDIME